MTGAGWQIVREKIITFSSRRMTLDSGKMSFVESVLQCTEFPESRAVFVSGLISGRLNRDAEVAEPSVFEGDSTRHATLR